MTATLGPTTREPVHPPTAPTGAHSALEQRLLAEEGRIYLTGIQALVRMLVDRSRNDERRGHRGSYYVSGYEGSPLAGYDLELARRSTLLSERRVVHAPAVNEELAVTALMGTQIAGRVARLRTDGVTGFWYGKAPGLDRATDAFRHAQMTGTAPAGGAVALVGDDPSAKSSSVPCSSEFAFADLQLPAFYPADPAEVLEYGQHAIELSRASGLWTAMKIGTNVADGASTARLRPWAAPELSELPEGLRAYSHEPHAKLLGADLARLERSLQQQRWPLVTEYIRRAGLDRVVGATRDARIGIVASGKTYLDLRQALDAVGLDGAALHRLGVRVLKPALLTPLDPVGLREFARGLDEIVVVEDKRAFLETAVRDLLYGTPDAPVVVGKRTADGRRLLADTGELDPDIIAPALVARMTAHGVPVREPVRPRVRISLPLAARTPYYCSGCPHNSSTTRPPEGSLVGGGIGCHAMVLMMPEEQVGQVTGLSQMGGEGAHWIGMAPFADAGHFVQNLGDGTFAHSGSLAVRAAVAAGVTMTYRILFNGTVAMTGGQDAVGGARGLAGIVATVLAEGVVRVVVTSEDLGRARSALRRAGLRRDHRVSVRHRNDLTQVQEELAAVAGVTVLVHDQECAAEKRRGRKRGTRTVPTERVVINERVCEGCGDCGKVSNCLSVHPVDTEFGRKTRIHQSSCNLDFSCLDGDCPSFVTVTPAPGPARRGPVPAPPVDLPDPVHPGEGTETRIRIAGVGGTGVVTVAQILATAAALDGRYVRALDQTGLAQKGGAVVSDLIVGEVDRERAAKLAEGECDLLLGCDPLVATDPAYLRVADPARTLAVLSTAEVPTGAMVVDPGASFPERSRIRDALADRVAHSHHVPCADLAEELFGDEQFANMILVGAAFQAGGIPLPASAIEQAIRINGVRVDANLAAFGHGRAVVAPGAAAGSSTRSGPPAPPPGTAPEDPTPDELVAGRVADLTAYQDAEYARSYARFVDEVRAAEEAGCPGSTTLTTAVARHLYKLMAYKDEYEVARLFLDPAFDRSIRDAWGSGTRVVHRLHPPVLRALGMRRKIGLGPWFRPVFRALYGMRRLRGTAADPFGYAHVRRVERELAAEYRAAVRAVLPRLSDRTLPLATELAALPDAVRGYEDVKLASVETYRARLAELREEIIRTAGDGR